MEKFVKELKETICLDFDLQEVKDVKEATENMVKRFSDEIEKVNPLFEVKSLVPCGSMAEGTRTWKLTGSNQEPVIETDFLAVLKNPAEDEITTVKHCNGFMQVIDDFDHLKHYYNKFAAVEPENALQVESIANSFQADLVKAVNKSCDCVASNDLDVTNGELNGKGCNVCRESKKTGYLELASHSEVSAHLVESCSLVLKWTSSSCSMKSPADSQGLNHVYILVNILPSFQLHKGSGLSVNNVKSHASQLECFLVPKVCATNHPTCWKVSYCVREIQMLQHASLQHKLAFSVVKVMTKWLFSDYHREGSLPSTYKVKTAALHHMNKCSSDKDVTQCVKAVLHDLIESYSSQSLPHSTSGLNLLAANKTENLPPQNNAWHKNRCQLISDCYSFVCSFFQNAQVGQSLNMQNTIQALQFIGLTYHAAWRQTELEPVYAVDKEKLKTTIQEQLTKSKSFSGISASESARLVVKKPCPNVHWTKKLRVWEYASVREMYAYHRFECPDPPGKCPGAEENILLQAQMNCDYFSMAHEDQVEWMTKLAHSENPDDIVAALKAVDMYSGVEKVKKGAGHHGKPASRKHHLEVAK